MSQTVITQAFETLKAQEAANGGMVTLDEFVFASVPDLNITDPIDRNEGLPPAAQIVHRQAVSKTGMVNSNAVVYSVVLGADVGDFEFNWVGLLNKASGVVAMIVHAPSQKKIRTQSGQQGNVLTRSFLMEYNGASQQTQIITPADTWQIDFTARLNGIDERVRLENIDTYGDAAFLGEGFKVIKNGNKYAVKQGVAYIAGLRAELLFDQDMTVSVRPSRIWADVCWQGTMTSVWAAQTKLTVADTLADYTDNDTRHHVFAIAEILADGSVKDLRPVSTPHALMAISPEPDTLPYFDQAAKARLSALSEFVRVMLSKSDRAEILNYLGLMLDNETGVSDSQVSVTQPFTGAAARSQHDKNADTLAAMDMAGMRGDGVNNDTSAFAALELEITGRVIELGYRKYKVDAIPVANIYVNGMFVTPSLETGQPVTLLMGSNGALVTATTDTGEYEARYLNPLTGDYQFSGRSTRDLFTLIASQNSRAGGPSRAVCVGSIYSYASGNVSGNYSARQSRATVPQSVNIGTEDCRADQGFRNINLGSITSHATGESSINLGSRRGWSAGYHTANIASVDAVAGGGKGAVLKANVNPDGTIGSVTVVNGGSGYSKDAQVRFYDRLGMPVVEAVATYTANASGVISSVTVTNPGAGYSTKTDPLFEVVQATILDAGNYSANIATANGCVTYGEISFNLGTNNCAAKASRSGNIAGNGSKTEGQYAVTIGTELSSATGGKSMVLASGGSNATADLAMVLSGTSSDATGVGSITIGRRTLNSEPRSVAFGDGSTGGASSANRKMHLHSNGDMDLAGSLKQSQTFTDIAKMFENIEPVAIPVGSLVAWEGRKVRLAKAGDVAFSVHSRTFAILLGDSAFTWASRTLRDDFGEIIYHEIPDPDWPSEIPDPAWPKEVPNPAHPQFDRVPVTNESGEVTGYVEIIATLPTIPNPIEPPMIATTQAQPKVKVPMENPDYDASLEQIPRSERRNEWTPVAHVGEVFTRVDASVVMDDYVTPSVVPGVGTKADGVTKLRCMEILRDYDNSRGYAIALCLRD